MTTVLSVGTFHDPEGLVEFDKEIERLKGKIEKLSVKEETGR